MPKFLAISLKRKELLDYDDVCDTAVQCYAWVTQPRQRKGRKGWSQGGLKGRQLEVGARRAPRLLVFWYWSPGKYVCASTLTQTQDKRHFQLVHNHHKLLAQLLHIEKGGHILKMECFWGESWFPKYKKLSRRWLFLFTFHWKFWAGKSPLYFTFSANSSSINAFSKLNILKRIV